MNKDLNAQYDIIKDAWLVTVPMGLSRSQMERIRNCIVQQKEAQLQFMSKVLYPDKFEITTKALNAARAGRVQQVLITKKNDPVSIFSSTERVNKSRSFYIPEGVTKQ